MRRALQTGIVALATLTSANGDKVTKAVPAPHCTVVASEKLPSEANYEGICAVIEHAIAARAPNVTYTAQVRIISASRLAATLVVNGKTLPEQKFAVMDRALNPSAVQHFANGLAEVIAKAAGE